MSQRIAVVTGGIGGLGTEICRRLAGSGRRVVAADLGTRGDRLEQFRAETRELNGALRFEPVDVGSFDSCRELVEKVSRDLGPIDIVVNAAGITRDVTLRKMEEGQ